MPLSSHIIDHFSMPNLPNYRAFFSGFTDLKITTEVSTELMPTPMDGEGQQIYAVRRAPTNLTQKSVFARYEAASCEIYHLEHCRGNISLKWHLQRHLHKFALQIIRGKLAMQK